MVQIFTDGSGNWKTGDGGWGVYIPSLDVRLSGFAKVTTNNRMEIVAVLEAIKYSEEHFKDDVTIYSDSEYTVNSYNFYCHSWKNNGWMTKSGSPVKNKDLMVELSKYNTNPKYTLEWVKGHDKSEGNIEADRLAYLAYSQKDKETQEALNEESLVVISGAHKGIGKLTMIFKNNGELLNKTEGGTNRYKDTSVFEATRYAYDKGIKIIRTDNKKYLEFDIKKERKGNTSSFWEYIRTMLVHNKIRYLPIIDKLHQGIISQYKKTVKEMQEEYYKNYIPDPPKRNMQNSYYFEKF